VDEAIDVSVNDGMRHRSIYISIFSYTCIKSPVSQIHLNAHILKTN
jgi:hypothetical protein